MDCSDEMMDCDDEMVDCSDEDDDDEMDCCDEMDCIGRVESCCNGVVNGIWSDEVVVVLLVALVVAEAELLLLGCWCLPYFD